MEHDFAAVRREIRTGVAFAIKGQADRLSSGNLFYIEIPLAI